MKPKYSYKVNVVPCFTLKSMFFDKEGLNNAHFSVVLPNLNDSRVYMPPARWILDLVSVNFLDSSMGLPPTL